MSEWKCPDCGKSHCAGHTGEELAAKLDPVEEIKKARAFLDSYGRPVNAPEPWRKEIYALWGQLARAVGAAERLTHNAAVQPTCREAARSAGTAGYTACGKTEET